MRYGEKPKFKTFDRSKRGNAYQAGLMAQKQMELNESAKIDNEMAEYNKSMRNYIGHGTAIQQGLLLENEYRESLTQIVLESAFADIYLKALYIDEPYKIEKQPQLMQYVSESFREEFGTDPNKTMAMLSKRSPFLEELCEAVKVKVDQKVKEARQAQTLSTKMDSILDCDNSVKVDVTKNPNVQEVTNVIKEKVLQVVQSEEKAQQEQQALVEEISASRSLNESTKLIKKGPVERFSLFRSLTIGNYKQALSEAAQDDAGMEDYVQLNESGAYSVDMNMMIAESVMQYTLLEMFHTLDMKDYTYRDVERMAKEKAYNSKIQ